MSESAISLNINAMSMDELAQGIQDGNRECIMRMYDLLHDDLLAIVRKTISSVRQSEYIVRKSFAEVVKNCEQIDPDFFELSLIQVLTENAHKEDIQNTYKKRAVRNHIQATSTVDAIRQRAVPAKLSATGSVTLVNDYAEALDTAEAVKEKRSLSDTLSMPVIATGVVAMAATGGAVVYHNDQVQKKELSYTQLMNSLNMDFLEDEEGNEVSEFEYAGINATKAISDLVITHSGNLSTSTKVIDLNRVGDNLVTYSLSATDKYNQTARMQAVRKYIVKDTQAPAITMNVDSVSITEGDSFDPLSVIASVSDVVDGDLQRVDTAPQLLENDALGRLYAQGWYQVFSDVDTNTPGEYTVTVHAVDNHGLASDTSIPVTVTKKKVLVSNVSITGSVPVNTGENANIIYTYLTTEAGFTKAAAAAVLANIQIECTFNPAAGSSYYGLCQWGGGRLSNLFAFCAQNGYASDSVDGQIRFMVAEMGGGMIAQMNSVSDSAEGAAEAGVYFRQNYERSAGLNNVANIAASFYNSL